MPRTPKEAPKGNGSKKAEGSKADKKQAVEKQAPPSPTDDVYAQLQAARGELMRAQRDLESVRLEMIEQKRKNSQHALAHAAELNVARTERDQLRMELDALKLMSHAAPKKRRQDDERTDQLEKELAGVHEELELALAQAKAQQAETRAALAEGQTALAETRRRLAEARRELDSRPTPAAGPAAPATSARSAAAAPPPVLLAAEPAASVPPAAAPPASAASAAPRGFFSRLFGWRAPSS
jgi:chromosome segregation ATPase